MFVVLRIDFAHTLRARSTFALLLIVMLVYDVALGRIVLFVRLVELIQIKVDLWFG